MAEHDRWTIWDAAPTADEAASKQHLTAFVNSFVQQSRRERWLHHLVKRPKQPKKWRNMANELENQLESSRYAIIKHSQIEQVRQSLKRVAVRAGQDKGLYYAFTDEPKLFSVDEAFTVGATDDALFSLVPGKVAVYFNSDGFLYLCQA